MMIRAKRKNKFSNYPFSKKWATGVLLAFLFFHGFGLSLAIGWTGALFYLVLWALSYLVIYWGACRTCVYYGKACPVPLEGSCVHYFFKKSPENMGFSGLICATASYGLRIGLPVGIMVHGKMTINGIVFGSVFLLFWMVHLYMTGCPNCINESCPLNPDYQGIS
ncbi:MAG: hypothetical protein KJ737_12205 [Proteobacteria bacterium]|nr:hypothetical protein [Pseudomonadota bacterium]